MMDHSSSWPLLLILSYQLILFVIGRVLENRKSSQSAHGGVSVSSLLEGSIFSSVLWSD